MKKHGSVAALALRLTALPTALVFLAIFLAQHLLFEDVLSWCFESALDGIGDYFNAVRIGKLGLYLLLIVLVLCCGELGGSKYTYTLGRLSIREQSVTWEFGLVFSGYFFLYWVFQLGMVFWLYSRYARWALPGENLLFLAAYRSDYFHTLLPLRDAWGYARNALLCLGYGFSASLAAHQLRHGRKHYILPAILIFLTSVVLPMGQATQHRDWLICGLMTAYLIIYGAIVKQEDAYED